MLTRDATAPAAMSFVDKEIIRPFGPSTKIVSDNGTSFTAYYLVLVMKNHEIKRRTAMAYASMSDGRAERMVRTLKSEIGTFVLD